MTTGITITFHEGRPVKARWNDHSNDIDDWCPWSGRELDEGECADLAQGETTDKPEDYPLCAAGCSASRAIIGDADDIEERQ